MYSEGRGGVICDGAVEREVVEYLLNNQFKGQSLHYDRVGVWSNVLTKGSKYQLPSLSEMKYLP